jgi:hypothetical protein
LVARHSRNRPKNLILITDAQIGNEPSILELMHSAPDLPVHCFGMDVALNDALLLALCRQQGGTFHSMNPNDDVQKAVTALGRTLGQPVLMDLRLSEGWETADAWIPNLYAGQIHYLSARSSASRPLELRARTDSVEPVKIEFSSQPVEFEAPYLHWCKSRIHRLMAEGKDSEAIELSVKGNLVCGLTAFVAWDDSEKVPIADHHLNQPSVEDRFMNGFVGCESPRVAGMFFGQRLWSDLPLGAPFDVTFGKSEATDEQTLLQLEQALKSQLSDICLQLGVTDWKGLVKAIFKWVAAASSHERMCRHREVLALMTEIERHRTPVLNSGTPPSADQVAEAGKQVRELLVSFAEKLPRRKWPFSQAR